MPGISLVTEKTKHVLLEQHRITYSDNLIIFSSYFLSLVASPYFYITLLILFFIVIFLYLLLIFYVSFLIL